MQKSRSNSQSKARKRKVKLAAEASMDKQNWATKFWELLNSISEFCLKLFLLMRNPVRKHFSLWPSDEKKEPSSSSPLEGPDAASSSAAVSTSSDANVANGAIEEQAGESTVNDNDEGPRHAPILTGRSDEVSKPDPEAVDKEFSSQLEGGVDGGIVRVGYHRKEEAEVKLVDRLREIEETKSERSGSDSESWKQKHDDLKKKHDDLKEEKEDFDETVLLREVFSIYEKTKKFVDMNKEIKKEVLELLKTDTEENENFRIVLRKTKNPYTKILRMMHFQGASTALDSSFERIEWLKEHRFPWFENDGPEYKWWRQNFQPRILEERLEILQEAGKKWDPKNDIFMFIKLISKLNSRLHPKVSEMSFDEMCRRGKKIWLKRPCGDRKIRGVRLRKTGFACP